MRRILILSISFLVLSFFFICEFSRNVNAFSDDEAKLARGKVIFNNSCSACHGLKGNGKGLVSSYLSIKPRNFTKGSYKFRTTPSGTMPTDIDLVRSISSGAHGASMPPFFAMKREDIYALISYIHFLTKEEYRKKLQKKLEKGKLTEERLNEKLERRMRVGTPIKIPSEPPMDEYSIKRGVETFNRLGCADCHGASGRGNGTRAKDLKDDWDNPITPADFTLSGGIKSGKLARDIYRTFMTGINGTPMASYADALSSDEAWDLAHYVLSLRRQRW